jgi:O-antigen ligase
VTTAFPQPFEAPEEAQPYPWTLPRLVALAEWLGAFVILFLMSNALLGPVFAPDQMPDNVPWLRMIWLPVYGMIALALLINPLRMTKVAVPAAMSLALVGWAFLSSRWSILPDVTVRRSLALLFTTLFGLYLAARYDWREFVELIAAVFLALAVGTLISCVAFPDFGITKEIHPGAWKGLWYEKNQLGGQMTIATLACACAAVTTPERRRLWIGATVLTVFLVVMSKSTTSALGVAIALGGMTGIALLRRGASIALMTLWLAVAGAGAFIALITIAPDLFFHLIGKDPTLTGRTDIWAALLRRVAIHPILGYGFGAFWYEQWGPAWFIRQEVQWTAPNGHNGWLDVLAQLGVVGLVLVALHYLSGAAAAAARLWRGEECYWAIMYIALFALFSVSESTIMQYNGISWVMYTATTAKLFEWRGLVGTAVPRARAIKLFPDE